MNLALQELRLLLDRPVAFHRIYARIAGGAVPGLFLSQAVYWSDKGDVDGWFYKTMADWQRETALTRTEQETARRKLRALGVLEEKHAGLPARLYFRIDGPRLLALVRESVAVDTENPHARLPETRSQDRREPASNAAESPRPTRREADGPARGFVARWDAGNAQPLSGTETTAETTVERDPSKPPCVTPDAETWLRRVFIDVCVRELGDEAPYESITTRGLNLWRDAGLPYERFLAGIDWARARTREYQGKQSPGRRIEKKGAYFFRCLEDWLATNGNRPSGIASEFADLPRRP
ncbi:MAG TPA: hypothetical protein VFW96_06445 [Thermomicrobiales bacterium]|nr:hypothetical protein [Thermomicrobiales bacterium]